jgi:hypothetical protein
VHLVNEEIREMRCYKFGFVQWKVRLAHDAIPILVGKLTRIWIALVTGTCLPIDPELVALSILHAGDKTALVTAAVRN